MAVVSFWGNSRKETGQTLSVAAIATAMGIEHNYKTLVISTGFREKTIESCFWKMNNATDKRRTITQPNTRIVMNNGFEGVVKVIQSNRTSSSIIRDYTRVVLRNRLDVLSAPKTEKPAIYNEETKFFKDIIRLADKEYDLVLVDIDKRMSNADKTAILQISNVIVFTLEQSLESIEIAKVLRQKNPATRNNNIMFLIGKYDYDSKYNKKNVSRYLKETLGVTAVPYNKIYDEATMEGKVVDYFLNHRGMQDYHDKNVKFIQETNETCEKIIQKLQDLQMRL